MSEEKKPGTESVGGLTRERIEQWLEGARDPQGHPGWHPETNGDIRALCELALSALSSAPVGTETGEERRLRHRLEKIDRALDELGAPKHEQVDGLTMELSRVGRIKRLGTAPAARLIHEEAIVALARRCGWSEVQSRPLECFIEDAVKSLVSASAPAAPVAEGWKVVPLQPDYSMELAGLEKLRTPNEDKSLNGVVQRIYRAMIYAAPQVITAEASSPVQGVSGKVQQSEGAHTHPVPTREAETACGAAPSSAVSATRCSTTTSSARKRWRR